MTLNEKMMLDALKQIVTARKNCINDECYSLNVGIHDTEILKTLSNAEHVIAVVTSDERPPLC